MSQSELITGRDAELGREEARPHIHVGHPTGEAKFWLDPEIGLALNHGLTAPRLARVQRIIKEHEDEIRAAWRRHFER